MTEDTDAVACRYTAQVDTDSDGYHIPVPDAEVEFGPLSTNGAYRVTIEHVDGQSQREGGDHRADQAQTATEEPGGQAPVREGERLNVEIEDLGQQGDGIARVGPGYVLIVPGSDIDDQLTVEVQQVTPSFGFAEAVADQSEQTGDKTNSTPSESEPNMTSEDGDASGEIQSASVSDGSTE